MLKKITFNMMLLFSCVKPTLCIYTFVYALLANFVHRTSIQSHPLSYNNQDSHANSQGLVMTQSSLPAITDFLLEIDALKLVKRCYHGVTIRFSASPSFDHNSTSFEIIHLSS